jgi:hypothetical protein
VRFLKIMKESFSDEILSAYVDGELFPQERGDVERWLESNSAARAKVEDFRRLSGLFSGLPRTEVPQEFPTTVMQQAERRMLLPETQAVATRRQFIGRWALTFGVTGATAAILFVAVSLALRDPGAPGAGLARNEPVPPNRVAESRRSSQERQSGAHLARSESERTNSKQLESFRASPRSSDAAAPEEAPAAGPAGGSPRRLTARRADAKKDAASPAGPAVGAPLGDDLPQLAKFNQAIEELSDADADPDLVPVVKVYVADVAEGMVLLQTIFDDNDVPSDGESQPTDEAGQKPVSPDRALMKAAETEALYVVAEPRQLIAAFTAMLSREPSAVRLAVEEPIEIAALDARLQERMKELSPGEIGRESTRRAVGREDGDGLELTARDKRPAPADGKPTADQSEKDSAKAGVKSDTKPPTNAARSSSDQVAEKKPKAAARPEPAEPQIKSKQAEVARSGKSDGSRKPALDARQTNERATDPTAADELAASQNGRGQSRQLVVPMPEAIRKRTESTDLKLRSSGDAEKTEKLLASGAASADRRAEKAKTPAEAESSQHPAQLVRVLIVIEREPAEPAAPPAKPADD